MKKVKTLISILLAICLSVGLCTGCSKKKDTAAQEDNLVETLISVLPDMASVYALNNNQNQEYFALGNEEIGSKNLTLYSKEKDAADWKQETFNLMDDINISEGENLWITGGDVTGRRLQCAGKAYKIHRFQ